MHFAQLITEPHNNGSLAQFSAWSNISSRIYIWLYITNYASYPNPTPIILKLGQTIQYLASHGVSGIFAEGSYLTSGGDMDAMKDYLVGRMLWDPGLNPDDVITEFLTGYFKAAAPYIREYLEIFQRSAAATGCRVGVHEYWNAPHLDPRSVIEAGTTFKTAVAATTPGTLERNSVDVAKLSVYYVAVIRWDELWGFAEGANLTWPLEPNRTAAWTEFSRIWNETGASSAMEGNFGLADIKKESMKAQGQLWAPTSCPPTCPCGD